MRTPFFLLLLAPLLCRAADVEPQPFLAGVRQILDASAAIGSPFPQQEQEELQRCIQANDADAVTRACGILDAHCLFDVEINPEQRVKVAQGPAKPILVEAGWRSFLVRVNNEAGVTAPLRVQSPEGKQVYVPGSPPVKPYAQPKDPGQPALSARWLQVDLMVAPPMKPQLSGLGLEYRIIELYSRDAGARQGTFSFDTGQGTQDLGFRNETSVLFDCHPTRQVKLQIVDENNEPCVGCLEVKDAAGRVYPSQIKRLAPDFFFHPQIYRRDGETLKLPDGEYDITFHRGPESILERRHVKVDDATQSLRFQVQRWIDPSKLGWWSGDHHIHAAGCAHYSVPTQGVMSTDMARHCQGEDLKIGANLTWGPCFDYQKQFFTGKEDKASQYPFMLRYDVEVSGFGSHRSGHLCLLKLKEQIYPGGDSTAHWPTLCLNTLRWAKKQGALCGPAHSGWGLEPSNEAAHGAANPNEVDQLPNDLIPRFDGIGANEYIVDVTHNVEGPDGKPTPAVDFMSTVDTPAPWELNMWYHTLNAGFRTRISGETDFPCIFGERVGLGRSYVKLPGKLTYDDWCEGIRAGRCYVGDGHSHIMDFQAGDTPVGEKNSEVHLPKPGSLHLSAKVAAYLNETPDDKLRNKKLTEKPYWNIERSRLGDSRSVPLEVIVNGRPVARKKLNADGHSEDVAFDVEITKSCWVALRIYPSSHTNPIFVLVDKRPIREKASLEWCLKSVDKCWSQKKDFIDARETNDAVAAYDHARQVYRERLAESAE